LIVKLDRTLCHCLLALLTTGALTLTTACGDDEAVGDDEAGETTAASGSDDAGTETDTGSMDGDTTTDTTSDDGNFIGDTGPGTTDTGTPGNLGEQCQGDTDCAEDLVCNNIMGLGGICSECASDADCPDGGNCTFDGAWFACGDGSQGQMCETDDSCADGLFCAEVINTGGLINGNFCSECAEDTDCADGLLCAPSVDFAGGMDISGERVCVEPGTVENNQLCDADGSGDEQCMGFCTTADLMGFIEVGICGECETDADCMGGMATCVPAEVGFNGFSGSVCG
jgi:hypothetical protein